MAPIKVATVGPNGWIPPAPGSIPAPPKPKPVDEHTLANIAQVRTTHLHLDWHVDWHKKLISGSVEHKIQVLENATENVILDTSFLDIGDVTVDGEKVQVKLGARQGSLGSPLTIPVGKRKKDEELTIKVHYSTTNKCTALGWLSKEQTDGKTNPFMYSQCQAIHARSLVPVIDSPSHKITYSSKVRSRIPVLMSALAAGSVGPEENSPGEALSSSQSNDASGDKVYEFKQPVGIPSYLIAIVGGDLVFRSLGPRVGVWAEPPMADRAQWEFEDSAHRYLAAAEQTISPYSWTRYDAVVLPRSFPYGGMENANLTTLTPALICGDRSQCDVLLHELAHSWSGNLTTCATWHDFWLNEGINVWIERLLLQVVHGDEGGPAYRGLSYIMGTKALADAYDQNKKNPRFRRLVPVYEAGEDPDDAFSSIPYEAGSNLILHLEETVGGLGLFLPFIRSHFATFYDRSVTTEEFRAHLADYYAGSEEITRKLKTVDWDAWLHNESGKLPVEMKYNDTLAEQSFALADRWIAAIKSGKLEGFSKDDTKGWSSDQRVVFLERLHLGPHVNAEIVKAIDDAYAFSKETNGEILLAFYLVALEDKDTAYAQKAADWCSTQGRMKYCRSIFRALFVVKPKLAVSTFLKSRDFYHPIAAGMIEKDLGVASAAHVTQPHAASSSSRCLISVIGSTGTGKSQLAVDIARALADGPSDAFGGLTRAEAISSDSMQTYRALDVITNKATPEEMAGVKHHLMSLLEPGQQYTVGEFVRDARELINGMQADECLPIVVGGTTYYVQHLLFPGRLVSQERQTQWSEDDEAPPALSPATQAALDERLSTLDEQQRQTWNSLAAARLGSLPTDVEPQQLWACLNMLDPDMARRWHWKDTRKVARSLRVLLETGRQHSEWIAGQEAAEQQRGAAEVAEEVPMRKLILWVWCEPEVLKERLARRVDKMVDRGLLDEIRELRRIAATQSTASEGVETDYTRGIYQAIGYKEFAEFLQYCDDGGSADDAEGKRLFAYAIERMQIGTRQYARSQTMWIRNKLAPEILRDENAELYLLDATDLTQWQESVRDVAVRLTKALLGGDPLPSPASLSPAAASQLPSTARDTADPLNRNAMEACPVCTTDPTAPVLVRRDQKALHERSKPHRWAVQRAKGPRTADDGAEVERKRAERQALRAWKDANEGAEP